MVLRVEVHPARDSASESEVKGKRRSQVSNFSPALQFHTNDWVKSRRGRMLATDDHWVVNDSPCTVDGENQQIATSGFSEVWPVGFIGFIGFHSHSRLLSSHRLGAPSNAIAAIAVDERLELKTRLARSRCDSILRMADGTSRPVCPDCLW